MGRAETQRRVGKALQKVDALKFSDSDPFVYASRKIGPIYIDVRQLSSSPKLWSEVVGEMVLSIDAEERATSFDVVSGGEVADLLFSVPVALRMGKPHIIIRKTAKTYGMGGRIAGLLRKGQRVVHVSDLITSGTSAVDWVSVIRGSGGDVRDYFAVVDRKQGGGEALDAVGVRLHALVTLDSEFLSLAAEEGMLEPEMATRVSAYLDDPERWAKDLLAAHPEILEKHLAAEQGSLVRREGVEIVTRGYPELAERLGPWIRERLRVLGVRERVDSVGYHPQ